MASVGNQLTPSGYVRPLRRAIGSTLSQAVVCIVLLALSVGMLRLACRSAWKEWRMTATKSVRHTMCPRVTQATKKAAAHHPSAWMYACITSFQFSRVITCRSAAWDEAIARQLDRLRAPRSSQLCAAARLEGGPECREEVAIIGGAAKVACRAQEAHPGSREGQQESAQEDGSRGESPQGRQDHVADAV